MENLQEKDLRRRLEEIVASEGQLSAPEIIAMLKAMLNEIDQTEVRGNEVDQIEANTGSNERIESFKQALPEQKDQRSVFTLIINGLIEGTITDLDLKTMIEEIIVYTQTLTTSAAITTTIEDISPSYVELKQIKLLRKLLEKNQDTLNQLLESVTALSIQASDIEPGIFENLNNLKHLQILGIIDTSDYETLEKLITEAQITHLEIPELQRYKIELGKAETLTHLKLNLFISRIHTLPPYLQSLTCLAHLSNLLKLYQHPCAQHLTTLRLELKLTQTDTVPSKSDLETITPENFPNLSKGYISNTHCWSKLTIQEILNKNQS